MVSTVKNADIVKTTAIVLAAGKSRRMKSDISKQYMLINDKPVLYYTLKAISDSKVDEIILVVSKGDEEYCFDEIVTKYEFSKVVKVIHGGTERYDSVYNGIEAIGYTDLVLIHDGARPLVEPKEINSLIAHAAINKACIAAVPSKDTIKIVDSDSFVQTTPVRDYVWQVQTPQVFDYFLVKAAYSKLMQKIKRFGAGKEVGTVGGLSITDDAMVVEDFDPNIKIKLVKCSYNNIKITTPEDMIYAKMVIDGRKKK